MGTVLSYEFSDDNDRLGLLRSEAENINHFWSEKPAFFLRLVNGDYIAGQTIFRESKSNELFELLNPGRASHFIVMSVESEANGEIPPYPHTTQQRPENGCESYRHQHRPSSHHSPPFI